MTAQSRALYDRSQSLLIRGVSENVRDSEYAPEVGSAEDIHQLQNTRALANEDGSVSTLQVAKQLRHIYGIDLGVVALSNAQKEQVRKARRNLLKKLSKQNNPPSYRPQS